MKNQKTMLFPLLFLFLCILIMGFFKSVIAQTIFLENFENGLGDWDNGDGIWEVGEPTISSVNCYDGKNCLATILNGNYDSDKDSRIISPPIRLPDVQDNEKVYVRFWQWFAYALHDYGYVQVREFDDETRRWSQTWERLSGNISEYSSHWAIIQAELTSKAGKKIQLGFYHHAKNCCDSLGWYIDNIEIKSIVLERKWNEENFEEGWNEWWTNKSIWEIGKPASGPKGCYESEQCAGTNLSGNYHSDTNSVLISPELRLPVVSGDDEVTLKFHHWFSYALHDYGIVKIVQFDEELQKWSDWIDVTGSISGNSGIWARKTIYLTPYSGKIIKIGFFHYAQSCCDASGWYIDDIQIFPKEESSCQYSINPTNQTFEVVGGKGIVNVIASQNNCQWTATTSDQWITIQSPASHSGNASISYTVSENIANQSRSGQIIIAGNKTVVITQEGKSCNFLVSETSKQVDAVEGQYNVNVSVSDGCQWSCKSEITWVIITSATNFNGSGTLQFTVLENLSSEMRTGKIFIADIPYTVIQKGKALCDYKLSEYSKKIDESGGEFSVSIDTEPACHWNVSSHVEWIHIKSGSSGSGQGVVSFSVDENTSTKRTGTITIADQTLTITQEQISCIYNLSENSKQVSKESGKYSVEVFTQNGCSWDAETSEQWLSIKSGNTGVGNGKVSYVVTENTEASPRSGTLLIAGMEYTVMQASSYSASVVIDTVISTSNIESQVCTSKDSSVWIAVMAQKVRSLDTYEIEILYDPERLEFIQVLEEDPLRDLHNILKQNGGSTLGFNAAKISPGVINIANSLVANNCEKAPNGSGLLSLIEFKMKNVETDEPTNIFITRAIFMDCNQFDDEVKNLSGAQLLPCSAAASLDADITTFFYDDIVTTTAIENTRSVLQNEIVQIAVVVQGVTNLDTYQIEVNFDPNRMTYIEAVEDSPPEIMNILKKYGGTTIGFTAHIPEPGIINISNTLVGKDKDKAPDGSGIAAILNFKVLAINSNDPINLSLDNVQFINSDQEAEIIYNLSGIRLIPNTCLKWDFNCDSIVNFKDLGLFADHWLFTFDHPGWDSTFDVVADRIINFKDLGQLADHWLEKKECTNLSGN